MFSPDDTVVAIATPSGRGGIGVVRISGPASTAIANVLSSRREALAPRHATLARIAAGAIADQCILTYFPSPHSFTGEDVVEISAHGSPVLLRAIVAAAVGAGARLAEPGEFTLRAFLHGRIDLVQAEAVGDLVQAVTPLQARAAFDQLEGTLTTRIREASAALFDLCARLEASLDFPEEGYHFVEPHAAEREIGGIIAKLDGLLANAARGRLVREGLQVVIAGPPNAGKSSLFNALAGADRAIVTDVPGTTRDLLTEVVDIGGIPVTLVDTAGVNVHTVDPIEIEGMSRAAAARDVASAVMVVLDQSCAPTESDRHLLADTAGRARIVVANKIDRAAVWNIAAFTNHPIVPVSARTGQGLERLREAIVGVLAAGEPTRDTPAITNIRHIRLIEAARAALERASAAASLATPEEFVLSDLNEGRAQLEEITGARTADDVLAAIFERFCVGK
jgi:tRNA modification GTPase